ncbi:MAG: hypothetical protein KDE47_07235, partial [Caldilineaceae bacterium]|nr:hypothetical protein [Caldilineaceae bacterium]
MSTYQPRFPLPKLRSRRSHLVPFAIGLLLLFGQTNLTRAISLRQIVTVDTDNVCAQLSLALDAAGNPVISYLDAVNEDLKLLRCNDHRCSGNDESIQIVDSLDNVGWHSSLGLDAADNPVISYVDRSNLALKLVHCNDHSCSGNDESIQTLDRAGFVGEFASLRLDRAGYPVISYADTTNGDLKLIHCNDPNCSGDDESIQRIDSEGTVGAYSSLQLDANGYPVISYFDQTNFDLKLAHCNDVNCAGNDESIQTVDSTDEVGAFTSLILDQAGHPVISFYDTTNSALKLAHCNDTDCRGNDESIQTVDSSGAVGGHSSLALNAAGHPIISYLDAGNGDL